MTKLSLRHDEMGKWVTDSHPRTALPHNDHSAAAAAVTPRTSAS
jgi:hypothetical protein